MTTILRAAVERARDQFFFYEKSHRDKVVKGPPMTPESRDDTLRKAEVNQQLGLQMQAALDESPVEMLELETIQDYRFGSMTKGQHYAFARRLTINPSHLPAALDAMERDGYTLVTAFGDATSEKMGFIFRINDGLSAPVLFMENQRLRKRVEELLGSNNDLVERERDAKRKLDAFQSNVPLDQIR